MAESLQSTTYVVPDAQSSIMHVDVGDGVEETSSGSSDSKQFRTNRSNKSTSGSHSRSRCSAGSSERSDSSSDHVKSRYEMYANGGGGDDDDGEGNGSGSVCHESVCHVFTNSLDDSGSSENLGDMSGESGGGDADISGGSNDGDVVLSGQLEEAVAHSHTPEVGMLLQPLPVERQRAREQRRHQAGSGAKIGTQIEALASMLEEAGSIQSPQSKTNVLSAVSEYIHLLEERNAKLKNELKQEQSKIIAEIHDVYRMQPSQNSKSSAPNVADVELSEPRAAVSPGNSPDYKLLFEHSPVPLAVTTLQGHIHVANNVFANTVGVANVRGLCLFDLAPDAGLEQHLRDAVSSVCASRDAVPSTRVDGVLPGYSLVISYVRPSSLTVALEKPFSPSDISQQRIVA